MHASEKKFVPVMITPFDLKAKVDLDAVSRLIDFYLAAGVKGFFANCLSSEMFSISDEERLALTKYVVDHVNGEVPVVATGSFGATMENKANFTASIFMIPALRRRCHDYQPLYANSWKMMKKCCLRNFEALFQPYGKHPAGDV